MADLATLQAQLEQLQALRAGGVERTRYDGKEVQYRTDAELADAIRDLEARIAGLQGQTIRTVRFTTSKGL